MAKVSFVLDGEKNALNIWNAVNSKETYGFDFKKTISQSLINLCENKDFSDVKEKIIADLSELHSSKITRKLIENINASWATIEGEFLKRLEKLTGRKIFEGNVVAYMTSINKCPYDPQEKTFFFNCFSNIYQIMQTSAHEIFHMQFHQYFFKDIEKYLGRKMTHDIKEAITILLDIEFLDLLIVKDRGYNAHSELRNFIKKEWEKCKDFELLLEKTKRYIEELKGGDFDNGKVN